MFLSDIQITENDTNEDNLARVFDAAVMEKQIESELSRIIDATTNRLLAVIQIDMDNSKEIRRLGIANKVHVLERINNGLSARFGSECLIRPQGTRDEVTIIKELENSADEAELLTQDILQYISSIPLVHMTSDSTYHVTYSAGIAIYPIHATSAIELLWLADGACRKSKDNGRNCWHLADTARLFPQLAEIDHARYLLLVEESRRTNKSVEMLVLEGYQLLFHKHFALNHYCCQPEDE